MYCKQFRPRSDTLFCGVHQTQIRHLVLRRPSDPDQTPCSAVHQTKIRYLVLRRPSDQIRHLVLRRPSDPDQTSCSAASIRPRSDALFCGFHQTQIRHFVLRRPSDPDQTPCSAASIRHLVLRRPSDPDQTPCSAASITKICLYNFEPLKPHFYIVKLGFTGVYTSFFLFLLENIDYWYSLEPHRRIEQKYEKISEFFI